MIPETFLQTSEVEGDLGGVTKNVFVREQIFYLKVKLFDIFNREDIYFSKAYFKCYVAEKPRSLEIRYFGIRRNRITNELLIPLKFAITDLLRHKFWIPLLWIGYVSPLQYCFSAASRFLLNFLVMNSVNLAKACVHSLMIKHTVVLALYFWSFWKSYDTGKKEWYLSSSLKLEVKKSRC